MEPPGISVTEIRLGLPNTHYYLYWEPAVPLPHAADQRAFLTTVRAASRRLGWRIYAAGNDAAAVRLVFETRIDNLENGLAALLRHARDYRVYMVQPVAALPLIASHVHQARHAGRAAAGGCAEMPEVHYRLFMGERAWAERMLDLLTRCARGAVTAPQRVESLAELAAAHENIRDAIAHAYDSGRYSLKDIAEYFDMHFSEVSAVINASVPDR